MTLEQIGNLIGEVQFQIKIYLTSNENNRALIDKKFNELDKLADDLLLNNAEYYGYCKHLYHINYSNFCYLIGETDEATKHQRLAKYFHQDFLNTKRQNSNVSEKIETFTITDKQYAIDSCENNNFLDILSKMDKHDFITVVIF